MIANPILFAFRMSNLYSLSPKDIGIVKQSTTDWFRTNYYYLVIKIGACVKFVLFSLYELEVYLFLLFPLIIISLMLTILPLPPPLLWMEAVGKRILKTQS
jgi:hypothetical protein